MFEPVRGGTRGGQAEFKWSDVSQDKDRENYLGHSINAPTGRWQKNKDIHWYQRDLQQDEDARREEIKRIQEAEAEALAAALCVSLWFSLVSSMLTSPCPYSVALQQERSPAHPLGWGRGRMLSLSRRRPCPLTGPWTRTRRSGDG
ncbi:kinase phosphorylation protein-domain-containing protein [Fomes fomentarius]|nr:kinase phosphorylation protein-domain-containing protein [Fomes fomentarius]